MRNLAIIPARGGSKRIPRKNIRDFLGKPIIAYSIEAALKSELFDEVMVSTDDDEIAKIALQFGAKVPFIRSSKNANDFATTADVILEVLDDYLKNGLSFEQVCCVYPTAPFVSAITLKDSLGLLISEEYDTVFPVVKYGYPIQRSLQQEGSRVSLVWPEHEGSRSQDLEARYHDAGQFYWVRVPPFFNSRKLFSKNSAFYEISELNFQDIDNETDWKLAELKYKLLND